MPFRYPHWKFPILSWDSNQIYAALTEFILLELDGNNSFSKIVYCAMLNQGMISGQQICELLYEQGVLEKDADYDNLVNNVTDAYAFIYNKIKNLEITPDMLALDPCSGSLGGHRPENRRSPCPCILSEL